MEATIIIKIVLAVIFMLAIVGKFTGKTKSTFEKAGYNPTAMYAIAVAEIVFTAGLFTRYDLFAAIGLLGIIGGALFTLVRQRAKPPHYILTFVTSILLCSLIVIQFPESLIS